MDDITRLFTGAVLHGQVDEQPKIDAELGDGGIATMEAAVNDNIDSLVKMASVCRIFTIGPLVTYGGLDVDPVAEYIVTRGGEACFHDFGVPVFSGMATKADDEVWDRRLFFATPATWAELYPWLAAVTAYDKRRRWYHKAMPHTVNIADIVAMYRPHPALYRPIAVPITVFGVSGNVHHVRFRQGRGLAGRALAERLPLDPAVCAESRRMFTGHPDPILNGEKLHGQ